MASSTSTLSQDGLLKWMFFFFLMVGGGYGPVTSVLSINFSKFNQNCPLFSRVYFFKQIGLFSQWLFHLWQFGMSAGWLPISLPFQFSIITYVSGDCETVIAVQSWVIIDLQMT